MDTPLPRMRKLKRQALVGNPRESPAAEASTLEDYLDSKSGSLLTPLALQSQGGSEYGEDSDSIEGDSKPDLVDQMLAKKSAAKSRTLNRATAKRFRTAAEYMAERTPEITNLLPDSELTYLELQAVGSDALNQYLVSLGLFSGSSRLSAATLEDATAMDERMVHWMNTQFLKGKRPRIGEKRWPRCKHLLRNTALRARRVSRVRSAASA